MQPRICQKNVSCGLIDVEDISPIEIYHSCILTFSVLGSSKQQRFYSSGQAPLDGVRWGWVTA